MRGARGLEKVLGGVGRVFPVISCVFLVGFAARASEAPIGKANLPPDDGVTCTVRAVPDSYFQDRVKVVRFPDRRELTVIGLNHGNRDLRGGNADSLSKAKTSIDLSRLVVSDPGAISDSREGLRFLRANSASFKFIGVEAAPATVAVNMKSYAALRSKLLKFGRLGEDAMMLSFGPDFYFHLTEAKSDRLVGVESQALGDAYLRALPAMEKAMSRLRTARFDADTAARLSDFLNSLATRYASFRPESDDSLREAQKKFTAQDYSRIEPFLRSRLDVMRAMKARDRHDVHQLLAQNASGVLFIGSSHLDSIASLLRDACVSIGAK